MKNIKNIPQWKEAKYEYEGTVIEFLYEHYGKRMKNLTLTAGRLKEEDRHLYNVVNGIAQGMGLAMGEIMLSTTEKNMRELHAFDKREQEFKKLSPEEQRSREKEKPSDKEKRKRKMQRYRFKKMKSCPNFLDTFGVTPKPHSYAHAESQLKISPA